MKKFLIILIVVAGLIVGVLLARDAIVKTAIEKGVELVTGLKLDIGSIKIGILKPVVDIKDIVLLNPSAFPDKTMVALPEIYVNYDLPSIIGGKIHLPEVRLALEEFTVIKNAQGKLNLDALRTVQAQKEGKPPSQNAPGKAPEIKIDALTLNIGKVIYKDYSKGATPETKEFNINLNESYTNIDNPYSLVSLIVVKALMHTSIADLTNFDLQGLQGTVGGAAASAEKMAQDTAKQATSAVKDLLKNPFGK